MSERKLLLPVECESGVYFKHPTAYIGENTDIGTGAYLWAYSRVSEGAKIGEGTILGSGVHIEDEVKVGSFNKIQRGSVLYTGVETEDFVFVGPNVTTTNDKTPRAFGEWAISKTKIEIGASIGANATIVCGSKVGALALVGAGSVVTKDVEPLQLVSGNPAHHKGWVDINSEIISRDISRPEKLNYLLENTESHIKDYLSEQEAKQ